ncbi:MAG: LLM class F420-dependent oxidoreductase [Acidobacteria bacterium]|nr:MAG: LLM class F420-dependent oxidoreductase [Acidobacteriota bacterium]REJ99395.1 MAG: LLM class F420-dependent oxidoreductase [Acidobacteriota bacterium]
MQLGVLVGYSGKKVSLPIDMVRHAEKLGFTSAWTAEAYGSDAVTTATWILANTEKIHVGTAIMQAPGRSPACAAMTAMTLSQLSGGRFLFGIGPSGPQVVEGWHGASYARPLSRMREYVEICRKIMARDEPVTYDGFHYQLPYKGPGATGLGKPLKSILEQTQVPIYTAAITPGGVRLAAEIADGFFPVWMNPERYDVFAEPIAEGFAEAGGGKSLDGFDVAPFVTVVMGDDLEECRNAVKPSLALYIGGMGAKSKNFYNDYAIALGYEEAAEQIQDLYLGGRQGEATMAVPDELVDDVHLVGPAGRIRERLQAWKDAGKKRHVGSMLLAVRQPEALELIAEEML